LTVTGHMAATSVAVSPETPSVAAGSEQAFIATASDGYNSWVVTDAVTWSIDEAGHGGSWDQSTGTYTSAMAGTWTVRATLGSISDTSILTVTPAGGGG
jgi:hypothetical protein